MTQSKEKLAVDVATPAGTAMPSLMEEIEGIQVVEEAEQLLVQGMKVDTDVLVVGSGPGGYVAAIRAAQLRGQVVLVEGRELGGTCLNRGCIPTKALLESVSVLHTLKKAREFGIECGEVKADFEKITARVQRVVKQLRSGVEFLMKKNDIRVVNGWASLKSAHTVLVTKPDGSSEEITARNIIIASGSRPSKVPVPGAEGDRALNSDTLLELRALPESLVIVGAGAVGVEFGQIFALLGSKVTMVEMMPRLLPLCEPEISEEMTRVLKKCGIAVETDSMVKSLSDTGDRIKVSYLTGGNGASDSVGEAKEIEADYVLIAVGRIAEVESLGLQALGVKLDRGKPIVNERMQTNIAGLYAVGDALRGVGLAHWASAEGIVAAENAMGKEATMGDRPIPACIYTEPEIATVGKTEQEALAAGHEIIVGKFPYRALGKSVASGAREGFFKIIADSDYERILGVHIVGPRATDIIGEATLALQFGATITELVETVHAHPTFAEGLVEAALAARGEAIHGA
ncbi:MAG: dihydrolipoyl dehydrogenase [Armatimonadetes bacterium]|nr:dihydrolipoyl dehydrogenase [Armatimonadota bacterium]